MSAPLPEPPVPVALTVAGSDSGGGAGIQADLRTFGALGVFGTSAVTCITAQNLGGVAAVAPIPPGDVRAQIDAVREGFAVGAAKTGMLFSTEIVEAVAAAAAAPGFPPLVVDPVMVAASGARLLRPEAESAYREALLPRAAAITPNLDEAEVLLGRRPRDPGEMAEAAGELGSRFGCAVLLKGGHLAGDPVDVLWFDGEITRWSGPRVAGVNPHGCGCVLSAALTAFLARGIPMTEACGRARDFVQASLRRPVLLGSGVAVLGVPEGFAE